MGREHSSKEAGATPGDMDIADPSTPGDNDAAGAPVVLDDDNLATPYDVIAPAGALVIQDIDCSSTDSRCSYSGKLRRWRSSDPRR